MPISDEGTAPPEDATASLGAAPRSGAAPAKSAALGPGDTLAGRYLLESELGRGGHGVVFAAKHLTTGGRVAIKMLSAPSPDAAARMLREAQLAAKIGSEHVAKVHDVAMHDGSPYVVMDHLEGETLAQRLRRVRQLSPGEAVALVVQACRGLAPFHARGIVHRDLKPSNLFLVRRSDGSDLVTVLDFGVAKEAADEGPGAGALTATNAVLGSPYYMAPEQVRSARDVDARADVWSLGVTLYELLAGRTPFAASTTPGTLAAVIADTPAPLDAPPALAAVVRRCLEKEPAQRYASVDELARALEASLEERRRPLRAPALVIVTAGAALALAIAFGSARSRPAEARPAPSGAVTVVSAPAIAPEPPATPTTPAIAPTVTAATSAAPPPHAAAPSTTTVRPVATTPPASARPAGAPIVRKPPDVATETSERK